MRVAMIPARGGSKRIPRKNIKLFHGKPIIAYSIETAIESGLFDAIIVSTDDEEIAEVSRRYGASTPFPRPDELADDHSTTLDVIRHTINWYSAQGQEIESLCCIYATAPFLRESDLIDGHKAVSEDNYNYAFAATEFSFPIQRAMKISKQGGVKMFYPEYLLTRSQDLEKSYHDAGQFYWGSPRAFLDDEPIFSESSKPILLPQYLVQDIDTLEDWKRAELMFQALRNEATC
jgi:pseudaminic acid cytidylyltransferase